MQDEAGRMAQRERTDKLTEQVGRTKKSTRLRFFHEQVGEKETKQKKPLFRSC
jgi:hypothetical protein